MWITYVAHILGGGLGLLAGYVALYATKGGSLHRRSGIVFVYAMLTMCFFGTVISIVRGAAPAINIPAAVLTAYLVTTALITVRPPLRYSRQVDRGLMFVAFAVGATSLVFAFALQGPAFPFLLFGVTGILAGVLDVRMLRVGRLQGVPRLRRHLWRMSFALFIAALSFFIGQAKVIPEPIRIYPLLAMPVLAVLMTMIYWLIRVRKRRPFRNLPAGAATEAAR